MTLISDPQNALVTAAGAPRKGRFRRPSAGTSATGAPIIPSVIFPSTTYTPQSTYKSVYVAPSVRQETISGVGETLPIVYGTERVGAKITAVTDYGGNLVIRCEWCQGPVDAVSAIYIDNAVSPASITWTHYTGTQVTADATLVAAYLAKGVTYTDTLTGVAYSVGVVPPAVTNGFPRAVAQIRGLQVAQTSGGTPAYSDNPVWLLAWIITQRIAASIDWTSFAAAAATCDALVGGEKKRVVGITLDTEQDAATWCDVIRGYAACYITYDNGLYGLIADAVGSSVLSVGQDDMRDGNISIVSRNLKTAPNKVRIEYTDTTATPWRPGFAEATTGDGLRVSEVKMTAINRYSQGNREAIERLNEFTLNYLSISFITKDSGFRLQQGDIIAVTHTVGFAGALFRVSQPPKTVEDGRWQIDATMYSASKYSSVVATAPSYTDTGIATPLAPPTVGAVTLTETIVTNASGALPLSRINATWPVLSYAFLVGYRVTVTDASGVVVDASDVPSNSYSSPPLNAFNTYTVRVYARSSVAVSATASSATISLVSSGIGALAIVYSSAITSAGWYLDGVEQFKIWQGDQAFRIRRQADIYEHVETAVYTGSNQLTPGRATPLLDDLKNGPLSVWTYADFAQSPVYNIGANRTTVIALLNIAKWTALYSTAVEITMDFSASPGMSPKVSGIGGNIYGTGRYAQINIRTLTEKFAGSSVYRFFWQIEFDAASIAALMPTVTDNFSVTTLTTGPLVVNLTTLLGRRYIVCNPPQVTPISSTAVTATSTNLTLSEVSDNTVEINAFDNTGARVAVVCTVSITGVAA